MLFSKIAHAHVGGLAKDPLSAGSNSRMIIRVFSRQPFRPGGRQQIIVCGDEGQGRQTIPRCSMMISLAGWPSTGIGACRLRRVF